jgi:hypothetical protein
MFTIYFSFSKLGLLCTQYKQVVSWICNRWFTSMHWICCHFPTLLFLMEFQFFPDWFIRNQWASASMYNCRKQGVFSILDITAVCKCKLEYHVQTMLLLVSFVEILPSILVSYVSYGCSMHLHLVALCYPCMQLSWNSNNPCLVYAFTWSKLDLATLFLFCCLPSDVPK